MPRFKHSSYFAFVAWRGKKFNYWLTGLDEVKADNKNLRALIEKKKAADGTSVSPPTPFNGDDVAQVSNRPVSIVTLPELRAMAHLSQKADRRVAQLGLATSSASSSDSDKTARYKVHFVRWTRGHTHTWVKSLKSGKEAKITSTVLYPQSWPHCNLSIIHGCHHIKYEELPLAEFVAGYSQILLSPDLSEVECSSRLKHLVRFVFFPALRLAGCVEFPRRGFVRDRTWITQMGGFVSTFRKPYFVWSS